MIAKADDPPRRRKLFGRKLGHKLKPAQQAVFAARMPGLRLNTGQLATPADLFALPPQRLALEIGFGAGEHLLARAQAAPQTGFIGCEVFINGIARLVSDVDAAGLENIRIYDEDARDILQGLPDACLDEVYLLYPDPWPKARHNKRRFVGPETLANLWRTMKVGATLQIASDIPDYVSWSLMHLRAHGGFCWRADSQSDWTQPPEGWPGTRYERKAIAAGRVPSYLLFVKDTEIYQGRL